MSNIATSGTYNPTTPRITKHNHGGLTSAEALARLSQSGPNVVQGEKTHPLKELIKRFRAPST
jgi:hypothetical protein